MSAPAVPVVTRFAPSPTGLLHLGHAYSALVAWRAAREAGGRFLLRIEDIDPGRCRTVFEASIREDLAWLGLEWEEPVRRQSAHMTDYAQALARLESLGLLYPCFCTRADIRREIERSGAAPHGPDGPVYPGTCRTLSPEIRATRISEGAPHALRLDMARAIEWAKATHGEPLLWRDLGHGAMAADPVRFGDVVLARKEVRTSYHLAVAVDDHLQGVTLVTRGIDLFEATHVHRLLQALLDLRVPEYRHHRLIAGPDGRRLAKRDRGLTLRALRLAGMSAADVRARVGLPD